MYIFINLSHGVSLPSIITGVQKSIHTAPGSLFPILPSVIPKGNVKLK